MRLSKPVREQYAAQSLITALSVWDAEQDWTTDPTLAFAWDRGRFTDPYRRVMLPKYPRTRQGVCQALANQFGRTAEDLTALIPTKAHRHGYAALWDVSKDSMGRLKQLVQSDGQAQWLWLVAEGKMDLQRAYREQCRDYQRRSDTQREAYRTLCELAGDLHPDDVAQFVEMGITSACLGERLDRSRAPRLDPYQVLRGIWHELRIFNGDEVQAAFTAFLAADQAKRAGEPDFRWSWGRGRTETAAPCFQALGLMWPCTEADVKQAYHRLAFAAHPDQGGSDAAFQALSEAYEAALKEVERRSQR